MVEIRNVWADNLETEMVIIRDLVEDYPYVAMVRPISGGIFPCTKHVTWSNGRVARGWLCTNNAAA